MEKIKPPGRKLFVIDIRFTRLINTDTINHIARERSKRMVQSDDFPRAPEALEPVDNQLRGQVGDHGLDPCHPLAGEIHVKRLSALAVQVMRDCCEVRALKVDDAADEALVPVCFADVAHDVQFIIVVRVADRELERVDSDDGAFCY
jgi:hypothetical protein